LDSPTPKNKLNDSANNSENQNRIDTLFTRDNSSFESAENVRSELTLLRADYINRISGMVKAVAAVERSLDKATEAVGYLEKLDELNAAELIEQYRRTSARFRGAFPSTFGLAPFSAGRKGRLKNPEVYK